MLCYIIFLELLYTHELFFWRLSLQSHWYFVHFSGQWSMCSEVCIRFPVHQHQKLLQTIYHYLSILVSEWAFFQAVGAFYTSWYGTESLTVFLMAGIVESTQQSWTERLLEWLSIGQVMQLFIVLRDLCVPKSSTCKSLHKKNTRHKGNLKRNKMKCAEPPGSQKYFQLLLMVMWRVSPMPTFHVGIHCLIGFHCLLEGLLEPFDSE